MPTASRSSSSRSRRTAVSSEHSDGRAAVRGAHPLVERLGRMEPQNAWVVSCYLKLEPRDRTRGKYLIKLKNRMRERLNALAEDVTREQRMRIERDLTRIREYLAQPTNLPPGQGIAIFASEEQDLFEAIPLPRVFRSRLAIARTPLVRELAALDDEYGLVLCAVCDRTSARIFAVTAFETREIDDLAGIEASRPGKFHGTRAFGSKGRGLTAPGEHNFHRRIREEKQRHFAAVAERLFVLARGEPVQGIVLAGVGTDVGAVLPHIHPYLADRVLGTTRLNPKSASPSEVMEAVLEVRRAREREWEAEHVRRLADTVGTGWAVNGVAAALGALAHGQVRTLLVRPDATSAGFRCDGDGRLTVSADGCDGTAAEPVPDVIDDAIEEALHQGCHVDVVEDAEARTAVDGLAALLRFKRV